MMVAMNGSNAAGELLAALSQYALRQGDRIDAGAEATSRKLLSGVRDLSAPQLLRTLSAKTSPCRESSGNEDNLARRQDSNVT